MREARGYFYDPPLDELPARATRNAARFVELALRAGADRRATVDAALHLLDEMAAGARRRHERRSVLENQPTL